MCRQSDSSKQKYVSRSVPVEESICSAERKSLSNGGAQPGFKRGQRAADLAEDKQSQEKTS